MSQFGADKFTTRSREALEAAQLAATTAGQHQHRADPPARRPAPAGRRHGRLDDRQGRRRPVRTRPGRRRPARRPAVGERRDREAAGGLGRPDPGAGAGARPRHVDEGRVRRDRAPPDRARDRREQRPEGADRRRSQRGRSARRAHGGAGQPSGDLAGGGVDVRGAGEVLGRPHRGCRGGPARPGHRPGRRDPPGRAGAVASYQEQPGAHRRARRRQDRRRRGPRAAGRRRRRARLPQGTPGALARPGGDGRGREVPRRVRGAAEGGARGDQGRGRPGHHVHRRAAHGRRSGRRRRLRDGRRQHAQADAGPGRAAHDRRDHARRVPRAGREGPRPRAPLPAGLRR